MRLRAGAALLVTALGGCSDSAARALDVTVRDSAGVRIVENTGIAALAPLGWRVGDPAVDLGGDDGGPVLSQVTDACRLADGSIVVASSGTQRLEVFGSNGRHLRSIGREGEGPGEFQSVFFVRALPGDSIAAWDPALGRLSVFAPGGTYARGAHPSSFLGAPLPRVHGVLPGGRFILAAGGGGAMPESGKVARDTLDWLVVDAAGGKVASFGRFAGTEQTALADARGMLVRPLPFGLSTVAAIHGDRLYIGSGDRYEVSVYDTRGVLRSAIRADRTRLAVTRADIEAFRRELVTFGGDADARRRQTQLLDAAPYPRAMPALAGLKVDSEGNVWVKETQRPGEDAEQAWTVFSPNGTARGTVALPKALRVTQIGPDWVLGLALDEDGTEHVRLYSLLKPR